MDDHTLDVAFVVPRRYDGTHTAYLTAKRPPEGKHRESWYLYDVEFDAQIVVTNSKDAECAAFSMLTMVLRHHRQA